MISKHLQPQGYFHPPHSWALIIFLKNWNMLLNMPMITIPPTISLNTGPDDYLIELAVAGFSKEGIELNCMKDSNCYRRTC